MVAPTHLVIGKGLVEVAAQVAKLGCRSDIPSGVCDGRLRPKSLPNKKVCPLRAPKNSNPCKAFSKTLYRKESFGKMSISTIYIARFRFSYHVSLRQTYFCTGFSINFLDIQFLKER